MSSTQLSATPPPPTNPKRKNPSNIKSFNLLTFFALCASALAAPTTAPSVPAPDRARHLRTHLLQLLEQSAHNNGTWPDIAADSDLTYRRPSPSTTTDPDQAFITASATVVLHESLTAHPAGVWVGYADGHLEFAPDASTLADCQSQLPLAHTAQVAMDAFNPGKYIRPTTNPARYVTIHLLDPANHPVSGAFLGSIGSFGDDFPSPHPPAFVFRGPLPHSTITPLTSNPDGLATLAADDFTVGMTHLSPTSTVPLFIFDQAHSLSALISLSDSQFNTQASLDVHLLPTCTIHGRISSLALEPVGRAVHWVAVMPFFAAGHFCQNPIESRNRSDEFSLPLP
ncbi:MAG TPA: hypothetical protein VFE58_16025, partial [Tepidisphaeraceae bacterium]|nr:hypothetical protein [Tepidisphaeraceae bacterium]